MNMEYNEQNRNIERRDATRTFLYIFKVYFLYLWSFIIQSWWTQNTKQDYIERQHKQQQQQHHKHTRSCNTHDTFAITFDLSAIPSYSSFIYLHIFLCYFYCLKRKDTWGSIATTVQSKPRKKTRTIQDSSNTSLNNSRQSPRPTRKRSLIPPSSKGYLWHLLAGTRAKPAWSHFKRGNPISPNKCV